MTTAQPFLRWVGGKRQLLSAIEPHLPARFNWYFEPFLGGGALFFHLLPRISPGQVALGDANQRLVRTYRGVRDDVEGVIRELRELAVGHASGGREFYNKVRAFPIDGVSSYAEAAAWFIYLNRTCFNGIYRVNRSGQFNVPIDESRTEICDEERLRACSDALRDVEVIVHRDFVSVGEQANEGDLVYFDPPYVPLSTTSSFTSYTADGFGAADQRRLRDLALRLRNRGVHVVLSNSSAPLVRELYWDFQLVEVDAKRSVNSKAEGRGAVKELLIIGRAA